MTRAIEIEPAGHEDFATSFARDQLMMLQCAASGTAQARLWRRATEGLLLGRFHRADPASCASSGAGGLSRRLTGGRVVPAGPGVVCITMAAPTVDWFAGQSGTDPDSEIGIRPRFPGGAALRPDQVLNRALRPVLALLRARGIDAFYPGRDLVTAGGRTIAHASFTVARDGVAVVEIHVAESPVFRSLESLLDRFDPGGVAGVDRGSLAASTSVEEEKSERRDDAEWAAQFADAAAELFSCQARLRGHGERFDGPHAAAGSADDGVEVTLAHASAARDFLLEPGPAPEGARSAATVSMLGVVECSGSLRGDRLTGLRVCGDLIAPFHTLDDIAAECEGEPLRPANIRKALARAMAGPRSFVLGLRELDELILRLA